MNVLARSLSRRLNHAGSALVKPRRFYKEVSLVDDVVNGKPVYKIALDGRILKSQARNPLEMDSHPLALAVAEEWASQEEHIEMGLMRLTGLAFTAIDNPLHMDNQKITDKIMEYLETDTVLFYNTDNEKLLEAQREKWDPVIVAANEDLNINLKPCVDLFNPDVVSAEDRRKVESWLLSHDFWSLTGMQYAVEASKSVLLPLSVLRFRVTAPEAIELGLLEQKVQSQVWGEVEWAHGIEEEELISRLSAACLFVYLNSNKHTITTK